MPWPTSNHESPDVDLKLPTVVAPHYLWAMLKTDGKSFRAEGYSEVRDNISTAISLFGEGTTGGQKPNADVSEQRLRTWKKAFEDMGILTVIDDKVSPTRFGRAILDGWTRVDQALTGANKRIALLGAEVANRVRLQIPGKLVSSVPDDADLFPIRAIWRTSRALNDKLHWQDINRVLGHIHYESEVSEAIEKIRNFRDRYGNSYEDGNLNELGASELSSDPRHITPWLNRASLGGLLLDSEADASGFRNLTDQGRSIVDDMLGEAPPSLPEDAGHEDYLKYLMEPVVEAEAAIAESDKPLVDEVIDAIERFGGTKLIALSGLPGTGKSRLARMAGELLVDGDESRLREIQFHEGLTYEDFVEGFVPRKDGSGFQLKGKVLRSINERALANPKQRHVLIIEEFTRANTHAVLGELLTYIEHRGRTFQWSISQDQSEIAENLVFLATMNPRDKSALQMDTAVKRRIHTIPVDPSTSGLREVLKECPTELIDEIVEWFEAHLTSLPFGHGIFAGATDEESVKLIWSGTAVPLLKDAIGTIAPTHKDAFDSFPVT